MREPVRFGTDGIRGIAGRHPVTVETATALGRAVARGGHRVLVGRDPRPSSPMLAAAVLAGVAAEGHALDAGVQPTPALQVCLGRSGTAARAIVVTASHNPPDDNGLKVLMEGGRKPGDAEIAELEAALSAEAVDGVPGVIEVVGHAVSAAWEQAVTEAVGDTARLRERRFAIDLAHGAATVAVPYLERLLPGVRLIGTGDGLPNDAVGSEHLEVLGRAVVDGQLDGGFAVDGDGDRCRVVDQRGRPVHGDAVTAVLAQAMGAPGLAVTVASTGALESLLAGVRVVRTAVGDRHVAAAMAALGLPLGAEESGHVLFADHPAGDGLLTGLRALDAAWRLAPTLAKAFGRYPAWPRRTAGVPVARRLALEDWPAMSAAIASAQAALPGGRVLVRHSGTEPVLRILVEAPDAAGLDGVLAALVAAASVPS